MIPALHFWWASDPCAERLFAQPWVAEQFCLLGASHNVSNNCRSNFCVSDSKCGGIPCADKKGREIASSLPCCEVDCSWKIRLSWAIYLFSTSFSRTHCRLCLTYNAIITLFVVAYITSKAHFVFSFYDQCFFSWYASNEGNRRKSSKNLIHSSHSSGASSHRMLPEYHTKQSYYWRPKVLSVCDKSKFKGKGRLASRKLIACLLAWENTDWKSYLWSCETGYFTPRLWTRLMTPISNWIIPL